MSSSRTETLTALVVLALGGCLFPTVASDADNDRLVDEIDNCPEAYNPDQLDIDADGVGDACQSCALPSGVDADADGIDDACDACVGAGPRYTDAGGDGIDDGCQACASAIGIDRDADGIDDGCDRCLLGPAHDEDHDGVADSCDACPSVSDPDQAQKEDADRLGDACDLDTANQVPRVFDPFVDVDPSVWTFPSGFTVAADHLTLSATTGRAQLNRIVAERMRAELVISSLSGGTQSSLGLEFSQACTVQSCGLRSVTCALAPSGAVTLVLDDGLGPTFTTSSSVGSLPFPVVLRLRSRKTFQGLEYSCAVLAGGVDRTTTLLTQGLQSSFDLWVTGNAVSAAIASFWVVNG